MKAEELQFKNIVVGLDFSKYSKTVLRQAMNLAKRFNAPLYVIYVAEEPVFLGPANLLSAGYTYVPPGETEMRESLRKFYKIETNQNVKVVVKVGEAAASIMKLAKSLESPLVVAGATGRLGFSRFMLGSQAEKLALEAHCPVWIHRGQKIRHFKFLLLPVDFSESTQKVIDLFRAAPMALRLNYLYVREPVTPVLDYPTYIELEKLLKKQNGEFVTAFKKRNAGLKVKIVEGDVVEEIAARSKNYDAIVMNPHNKTKVFKKFGKVTSKVIRLSEVPVLIIRP